MTASTFTCSGTIHFGSGSVRKLPDVVTGNFFLFTGSRPERNARVVELLEGKAKQAGNYSVCGEPDASTAVEAAMELRDSGAQCVVAIGGGSVIDAAKAAAALATNPGPAMDYLEVVGKGRPLVEDPLPMVAVPTTFGTGSEVTRNAVLGAKDHRRKVSMRDPRMVPSHAIVDHDLSSGLPREVAASSGVDALVHVCEAYVCVQPCEVMDPLCESAMSKGFAQIERYCDEPDEASRQAMAEVSLCGGLMIANARLGAVHGFAGVIGGMTGAAHGKICAALFSHVFRANIAALRELGSSDRALGRYASAARLATGRKEPDALPDAIDSLVKASGLPALGELGVSEDDHEAIVGQAKGSSSMRGNPVELDDAALLSVLERAH